MRSAHENVHAVKTETQSTLTKTVTTKAQSGSDNGPLGHTKITRRQSPHTKCHKTTMPREESNGKQITIGYTVDAQREASKVRSMLAKELRWAEVYWIFG
jgi:hypothetical protein